MGKVVDQRPDPVERRPGHVLGLPRVEVGDGLLVAHQPASDSPPSWTSTLRSDASTRPSVSIAPAPQRSPRASSIRARSAAGARTTTRSTGTLSETLASALCL